MFWILPAAMAAAGGISNLLSGQAQNKQQRENLKRAQQELEQGLITKEQLDRFLQSNKMAFGRQLTSLMNTTAIRTGGIANANVVKAAATAPVVAAEAQSELGIQENAANQNRAIHSQIAQLALNQPVSDPIGDFISGATSGASLGMELGKFGKFMGDLNSTTTPTPASPNPTGTPGMDGSSLSFGAEKLQTGMGQLNAGANVSNPYIDYLGNDQLYMKQNRWQGFDFSIFN